MTSETVHASNSLAAHSANATRKKIHRDPKCITRSGGQSIASLKDSEILSMVLGLPDPHVAETMLNTHSIQALASMSLDQLESSPAIDRKSAPTLVAVAEMIRRINRPAEYEPNTRLLNEITSKVESLRHEQKEHLVVILLNVRGQIIGKHTVSIGTLTASLAHPREVFRPVMQHPKGAASIVLVHNHPSGDPSPSDEDQMLTKRMSQAGNMLGIHLCDHLIVASYGTYSFKTAGAL